ncbi:hypothetical protein D3C80_1895410 [compost metagenome]
MAHLVLEEAKIVGSPVDGHIRILLTQHAQDRLYRYGVQLTQSTALNRKLKGFGSNVANIFDSTPAKQVVQQEPKLCSVPKIGVFAFKFAA